MSDVPIFFQGEVMLANWADHHAQGPRVTFFLADSNDLEPFRSCTVRRGKQAGARFQMVLVEIDTDEKPVSHPSNAAHLKITSPEFVTYARGITRQLMSTEAIRNWAKGIIGVESLAELDTDPGALERYHRLIRIPFDLWLIRQSGDRDDGNNELDSGHNVDVE